MKSSGHCGIGDMSGKLMASLAIWSTLSLSRMPVWEGIHIRIGKDVSLFWIFSISVTRGCEKVCLGCIDCNADSESEIIREFWIFLIFTLI